MDYFRRSADVATKPFIYLSAGVSNAEFTKDRYGVDVMKVEVPVNMRFVEGAACSGGASAYSRQEAMDYFRRSADVATTETLAVAYSTAVAAEKEDSVARSAARETVPTGPPSWLAEAATPSTTPRTFDSKTSASSFRARRLLSRSAAA